MRWTFFVGTRCNALVLFFYRFHLLFLKSWQVVAKLVLIFSNPRKQGYFAHIVQVTRFRFMGLRLGFGSG